MVEIKTSHSSDMDSSSRRAVVDCNFNGRRGTWRKLILFKLCVCLIAMILAFALAGYWPTSYPDSASELEPVVLQNAVESFTMTYSYDLPGGSMKNTWNVESATTTNFMAACTTETISHPPGAGPSTITGTWYRGTKDLSWTTDLLGKSDQCSSGENYNASASVAATCLFPADACIAAGTTTIKYTIGSAFIYFALWVKISFIDRPEDMNGETLRLWNLAHLVLTLTAFALTASAESAYKTSCGNLIEETLTKQMAQVGAKRGDVVRVSGAALNLLVASTIFGALMFVIGLVEFFIYYRHGKRLGLGDRDWKGDADDRRRLGGGPASDADTTIGGLPVNSHVIRHGETPLGHEL